MNMGRLQSKITPALQRYNDLNQEKRDLFKSTLADLTGFMLL